MSATGRLVEAGREAGILDETGALTGRRLSQDVPAQGANGTRVNPADVRATIQQLERSKTMKEQPVAFWFKGTARWQHPGWSYCYNEVAKDDGEYRDNRMKDGKTAQKWLVAHGYRIVYRSPVKSEISPVTECWGHVRFFGEPDNPDRFVPKSTNELREYITLALKPEEADAPSLEAFDAPVQQPNEHEQLATTLAARLVALGWVTGTTEAVGTSLVDTLTL